MYQEHRPASGTGSLYPHSDINGCADKLSDGSDQLKDGISDLNDGAKELNKGQKKFYKEGIKKLDDTVNGDLQDILDRFEVIQSDDVMYTHSQTDPAIWTEMLNLFSNLTRLKSVIMRNRYHKLIAIL